MVRFVYGLMVAGLVVYGGLARAVTPSVDESVLNPKGRDVLVRLNAEVGTLAVLKHRIQFSKSGSMIDYVSEGGQDLSLIHI